MTATAKFADILLPVNTIWERNDFARPWLSGPYYIYFNKAIPSLYESKTDLDIFTELSHRLGIEGYSDKTEEEWIQEIVHTSPDLSRDIPDYEEFKRKGSVKMKLPNPFISFEREIADPEKYPFPTPSSKIEIHSQKIAELNDPKLPPIPKHLETWESSDDKLAKKYPLQLITIHFKTRAHSTFDNILWLQELEPQTIWISIADAEKRGIRDGDEVKIFNDRGEMIIQAKVTERIMPGVVSVGQGAWYSPDEKGIDHGGCVNVLTKDEYSPGGAFPSNTCLVQVEKI